MSTTKSSSTSALYDDVSRASFYTTTPSEQPMPPLSAFKRNKDIEGSSNSNEESVSTDAGLVEGSSNKDENELSLKRPCGVSPSSEHANVRPSEMDEGTQLCFASFVVFTSACARNEELPVSGIPISIVHLVWKLILSVAKLEAQPEKISSNTELFNFHRVSFRETEVECLKLSRSANVEYGERLFSNLFDKGKLVGFGETKVDVIKVWHETLVNLLENSEGDKVHKVYAMLYIPRHTLSYDKEKALSFLGDHKFARERIMILGVSLAAEVLVSDCEGVSDVLPNAYDIMSTELQNYPARTPEASVEIARGLLTLANSFQRMSLASLPLYFQALSIFESLTSSGSTIPKPLLELCQMDMAEVLHNVGKLSGQKSYLDRELQIRQVLLGKHHPLIANTLHCIGSLHVNQNQFKEALENFEEALRIRRLAGMDAIGLEPSVLDASRDIELSIADTLHWKGVVLKKMMKFNEAKECFKEAVKIRNLFISVEREEIAVLYHDLGFVEDKKGNTAAALAQYGEALRIRRACSKGREGKERILETLCDMARVYSDTGEIGYAIECYREAAENKQSVIVETVNKMKMWSIRETAKLLPKPLFHAGQDDKEVNILIRQVDDVWKDFTDHEKKDLAELLRIMVNAIDLMIEEYGKDSASVSSIFQSMGEVYLKIGFYNKATKCLEEAYKIRCHTLEIRDKLSALITYELAICYTNQGRDHQAIDMYGECLTLWKNLQCDVKEQEQFIGDSYYNMGNAQCALGREDALSSLSASHKIRQSQDPQDEIDIRKVQYCIGVANVHLRKYTTARLVFDAVLPEFKLHFGAEHLYVAYALYYIGQLNQAISLTSPSTDLLSKADRNYKLALSMFSKQLRSDDICLAHVHHSLGTMRSILEEYEEAKEHFDYSLKIYQMYSGDNLLVSTTLNHLGVIMTCTNDDDMSMVCLNEALRIRTNLLGKNSVNRAVILHNIGGVHVKCRRYQEAMKCYEEVLEVRLKCLGDEDLNVAKTLNNMGIVHARLGEFKMARKRLKSALKIRNIWEADTEGVASSLYNLGNVLARTQRFAEALKCYDESLNIRRSLFGDNHHTIATMMHNLGVLYEEKREYLSARNWYDEALRVKRILLGPDSLSLVATLSKIGDLHIISSDYHSALMCYQKVLKVQKRHYGPDHFEISKTFLCIGNVRKMTGSLDMAAMCIEEALRIREEKFGNRHVDVASALYLLGTVNELMGENEDAFLCYGNAYRIYREKKGNSQQRRHVVNALRKIVSNTPNSNTGFCDLLVITGDCWLSFEGVLTDWFKLIKCYVSLPTPRLVRDVLFSDISPVTSQRSLTNKEPPLFDTMFQAPDTLVYA